MVLILFIFLGILFGAMPGTQPALYGAPSKGSPVRTDIFWSGSWELGGRLQERADLALSLPRVGLDFRFQALDRRPTSSWDEFAHNGLSSLGGGIYHRPTGSRLVYGLLEEWGLPARIRNPWIRSLPLAEIHAPSLADLRTDVVSTSNPAAYLYLGTPRFGPWTAFVSARADRLALPDFGAGIQGIFKNGSTFRIESFHTRKTLQARSPSTWFSQNPPLPERDFLLDALGLYYSSEIFGIAIDGAHSKTFAYGEGLYGNIGVRIGDKPWRLSFAADAAAGRYVGRDGNIPGSGLRLGTVLERRGKRGSLFKAGSTLQTPGLGEVFNKSSTSFYLRLPRPRSADWRFNFSGFSLALKRNDISDDEAGDSASVSTVMLFGPLQANLNTGIKWKSSKTLLPYPDFRNLDSLTVFNTGLKLSSAIKKLTLQTSLAYTLETDKASYFDSTVSAAYNFKFGRLRCHIDYLGKKKEFKFGLSWQLRHKF